MNKVESRKAKKTVLLESTLMSTSEIFSLCHCEMHKILTLCVGGWGSFLSYGISFDFRKAHVPFLISATVSPGKQQEDSKTKTHTSFSFCLFSAFFSSFDSLCHSLSAFSSSSSSCFPSLTLTRCLTCLSFSISAHSLLPSLSYSFCLK